MGAFTVTTSMGDTDHSFSAEKMDDVQHKHTHGTDTEQVHRPGSPQRTTSSHETKGNSSEDDERVVFEPLDTDPYHLSYTCLLIPRFSSHFLMGDLAQRLPDWMQQICISFGWRLEFINIKPEYFQWAISVPPSTSTAYFIKAIRQQTTLYVFEEFPRFRRENRSNDFWAPGYLIYFGIQPHPIEVIRTFIRQTRQQQGLLSNG